MQQLTATATGSTSARLLWSAQAAPGATYTVYRGTSSTFGSATALGGAQAVGTASYNDYTASPATQYWYWIKDQNSNVTGPATCTTTATVTNQDALDEAQTNALTQWAYAVWDGLFPVYWRYQDPPQPFDPRIVLNPVAVVGGENTGYNDTVGESIIDAQLATISVSVYSNPTPAQRYLAGNTGLPSGNYTLSVDLGGTTTPQTVTFATAPANGTAVTQAFVALLNQTQAQNQQTGLYAWAYGTDPNNQLLAIQPVDTNETLVVTAGTNMTVSAYTPPKAMAIAQRLRASLGDPNVQDDVVGLGAAGIGVGKREAVQNVSAMLDTASELCASFDFHINLAEVYPITTPIIDTVQAPTGTPVY